MLNHTNRNIGQNWDFSILTFHKISLFVLLFLLTGLFSSCGSNEDDLNEDLLSAIRNDHKLDQEEYQKVIAKVEANYTSFPTLVNENLKVIPEKFASYVERLARNRNITLERDNIWTPVSKSSRPFNMNVFIENSASMDGYVGGVTQFENIIYNLLVDIKISGLCENMNLNYINNSVPYSKPKANDRDVEDFIQKLEPATFRQRGGNRSSSDMKNILDTILQEQDTNNAVMLITDCVFSPGKNNGDAVEYLNNQSVGLKNIFSRKITKQPIAFLLLQMDSEFRGKYFDRYDTPHILNGEMRPFYVMLIASPAQMSALLEKPGFIAARSKARNQLLLLPISKPWDIPFKILRTPRIGNFEPDPEDPTRSINEAIVSDVQKTKGVFGISLGARLDQLHLSESYLTDTNNYAISSPDYQLQIDLLGDKKSNLLADYTHQFNLSTRKLKEEELTITLFSRLPGWIDESNSTDDTGIGYNHTEMQKTFGIAFLVRGIYDAYRLNNQSAPVDSYAVARFSLNIKTAK